MPFRMPFNMPYFYKPNYKYTYSPQYVKEPINTSTKSRNIFQKPSDEKKSEDSKSNQDNCSSESSDEYFFEIFGLKLYFDDVLIICIIYFLYTEGVQDKELFLCLILLLLS